MNKKIIKTAGIGVSGYRAVLGPSVICFLTLKNNHIDFDMNIEKIEQDIINNAEKLSIELCNPSETELKIIKMMKKWSEVDNYIFIKFWDYPNHQLTKAAYIIAKIKRKEIIHSIQNKYQTYGYIGMGYKEDPYTDAFLKNYFNINKKFPSEVDLELISPYLRK